jgi:DnaJ family protein C protein 9
MIDYQENINRKNFSLYRFLTFYRCQAFGKDALEDLYCFVLGVSSDATQAQLKKAYHKLALAHHPDKVSPKSSAEDVSAAKLKFQAISVTYQILSNEERRREYDNSGELIDDDDFASSSSFTQWEQFFKNLFPGINFDDIDKFAVKYKESDEEKNDVLKYYQLYRGDLNKMVNCVMCSEKSDKQRWVKYYIEPAIRRGEIPRFEALEKTLGNDYDYDYDDVSDIDGVHEDVCDVHEVKTKLKSTKASLRKKGTTTAKTKPQKKLSREAEEKMAEALIAQIRGKSQNGSSLLTKRAEAFDSLVSQLESKYANGRGKNKKGAVVAEIPDEAFDRIQAKIRKK